MNRRDIPIENSKPNLTHNVYDHRIHGEYTYGLPRRFLQVLHDQSINPMRYKMIIRVDDELFVDSLKDSICFSSPKQDIPRD